MLEDAPKKTRSKKSKSTLVLTENQTDDDYKDQEIPGLIPQMKDLADQLPEDFRTPANRIIGLFGVAVIALIAIFVLSAIVANFTGHSDQIMTIFYAEIILVGTVTVAAIVNEIRKTAK